MSNNRPYVAEMLAVVAMGERYYCPPLSENGNKVLQMGRRLQVFKRLNDFYHAINISDDIYRDIGLLFVDKPHKKDL